MSTPAIQLKPETQLDRSDVHECLLDNLSKCQDLDCQKAVLRHYDAGIAARERQRIRRTLATYAESLIEQANEQRSEADKLVVAAREIETMLEWTEADNGDKT